MVTPRTVERFRRDLANSGRRGWVPRGNAARLRCSVQLMNGSWGSATISVKGRQAGGMSSDFSPAKSWASGSVADIVLTDEDLEGIEEIEFVQSSATSTGDVMITVTEEVET